MMNDDINIICFIIKKSKEKRVRGEAAWRFFSSSVEMLFRTSAK